LTRRAFARLFVALELPVGVCDELAAWARLARSGGAAGLRLLEPDALHATVCFLGSRPVNEIERLGAAVVACAMPVRQLHVGAPLWLPPRRPRVLAVEVRDPEGDLGALQQAVVRGVSAACDWEPDRRRFRPHVTVARMRQGAAPRERELDATPALTFAGTALTLFRSWPSPQGASYEPLARAELLEQPPLASPLASPRDTASDRPRSPTGRLRLGQRGARGSAGET
jgi:RNA 2',3'-cyclic 3'-phosphodiesterase